MFVTGNSCNLLSSKLLSAAAQGVTGVAPADEWSLKESSEAWLKLRHWQLSVSQISLKVQRPCLLGEEASIVGGLLGEEAFHQLETKAKEGEALIIEDGVEGLAEDHLLCHLPGGFLAFLGAATSQNFCAFMKRCDEIEEEDKCCFWAVVMLKAGLVDMAANKLKQGELAFAFWWERVDERAKKSARCRSEPIRSARKAPKEGEDDEERERAMEACSKSGLMS